MAAAAHSGKMRETQELASMHIEQLLPNVVGGKDSLRTRFLAEALTNGLKAEQASVLFSLIPDPLANAGAFLDNMTGLWRYEFGLPFQVKDKPIWGTHMWVPVEIIYAAGFFAHLRVSGDKRTDYLRRLADPNKHKDVLVEMIPACAVPAEIHMDFEVPGLGTGDRTVDWSIGPHANRTVLLDVKNRVVDLIAIMGDLKDEDPSAPPDHDPALLFRSVDQKLIAADPDSRLQGVWVVTNIKQDEDRLQGAFAELDQSKVHFAILGDWKPDAHVLVQREQDRKYLLELFQLQQSTRFTFKNPNAG